MSAALLILVSGIYAAVGIKQALLGNVPMAIVFFAYAVANTAMLFVVS